MDMGTSAPQAGSRAVSFRERLRFPAGLGICGDGREQIVNGIEKGKPSLLRLNRSARRASAELSGVFGIPSARQASGISPTAGPRQLCASILHHCPSKVGLA
jgi:hypothetical protein